MRYALLTCSWLSSHDDQKSVVATYAEEVTNYILRTVPPEDEFCTSEHRILNAPCLMGLQQSTRITYLGLILHNHIAAFPHDSGAIIKTSRKKGNQFVWAIPPHPQVTAIKETDTFRFKEALGRFPSSWELDRTNCPQAGTIGHYACGWCTFHRQPILICGCRQRAGD